MADIITATIAITLGMTVYDAPEGKDLACSGHQYSTTEQWVALPIEWVKGGHVDCGDLVYARSRSGHWLRGVPVWDTGCLLHHSVWDSEGKWGFGIDMPLHMAKDMRFTTESAAMWVWRRDTATWWTPPPTLAWATKHCGGKLTWDGSFPGPYQPY